MRIQAGFLIFVIVFFCLTAGRVSAGDGLTGYYYQGYSVVDGIITTDGLTESFNRVDSNIDFWNGSRYYRWEPVSGYTNNYSVVWSGYIRIDTAGVYGFGTISDDGSQIWIDRDLVVDNGEMQWYDWEDNISEGNTSGESFPSLYLDPGYHEIKIAFYEGSYYDGIELWWLTPGSGTSDIPYYGTTFHGSPPTYNSGTNWEIVPQDVLYTVAPEPASFVLLVVGGGVLALRRSFRKKPSRLTMEGFPPEVKIQN